GAFNLRHPFSPKSTYQLPRGSTDNLMDYGVPEQGTELWKYQWDLIHNPENVIFAWTQGESEGAMEILSLTELLQKRILDKLINNQEVFPKYAYNNQAVLTSITEFDETYSGGGKYINGRLIIGNDTKHNKTDEDVLSTIYHEFMHYLNDLYDIYPYRMEDKIQGIVYSKYESCYEEKMQNTEEFLQSAYESYLTYLVNIPEQATKAFNMPMNYQELSEDELILLNEYIESNDLKPDVICFPYQYTPSNFSNDEINAHKETLKANNLKVFEMNMEKVSFYNSEIERYTKKKEKAEKYEAENNLNAEGYEN
ncbi:MAG: hypothetical protein JXB49_25985, partial [Bacteroidales bacterium]|nr:hypothetical protein [Bacteroidales bacterium]